MKRLAVFVLSMFLLSGVPQSVSAISAVPQAPTVTNTPDIIVSAIVGSPTLNYLEIYNQSSAPVQLDGWSFTFGCRDGQTATIAFPSGWILSKNYLTFENHGADTTADIFNSPITCSTAFPLAQLQVSNGNIAEQTITFPSTLPAALATGMKQKQRDNSSTSVRTLSGSFAADYIAFSAADTTLLSDPLYTPPTDAAGLKIVELLANSPNCSPLDTSFTCSDFVKLFNSSNTPVNLSLYRLHTNYGGNKSSSSNTIGLNGMLAAGAYTIVNTKNDGSPLSLTGSGGYVWLEDGVGAQIYQPVVQYPDASSTTKIGWAWALNGSTWQWTSAPTVYANSFPPQAQVTSSAATLLKPCAATQYRSTTTNRCRSLISASTLAPCSASQERNPATGRCRSILTASGSTLKPCQPGWTRNPATNRCRKSLVLGATTKIQDVKVAKVAHNWRWYIAAAVVLTAISYAAYEWRQEILVLINRAHGQRSYLQRKLRQKLLRR